VAVRCVLIVVAVIVGGWLVLGYRADRLQSHARDAFYRVGHGQSLTAKQLGHAESSLESARLLNADPGPLINESLLLIAMGDRARARAAATRLIRQEPDNLDGWRLMYALAATPASADHARRMVQALDPWAALRLR
jgi:hypothetical protein